MQHFLITQGFKLEKTALESPKPVFGIKWPDPPFMSKLYCQYIQNSYEKIIPVDLISKT